MREKLYITKTQLKALKDLKIETTMFGPGLSYQEKTGLSLVEKGLAEIIASGPCRGVDSRRKNGCITAKITQKGRDYLNFS